MNSYKRLKTQNLPPILFPATNSTERRILAKFKADKLIHSIGPRLYASVPDSKVAEVVRSSWSTIVSRLFPGVLLSHRSALEYKPGPQGEIFLTANTNREIRYPGLRLRFIRGPKPLEDDPPFLSLRASSQARAFLENLSARPSPKSRSLPIEELEKRLEQVLRDGGEPAINQLRDRARQIAKNLRWKKEFERLDAMIGALLGTRQVRHLKSAAARARAAGEPYDPACLERLQLLFGELRTRALPEIRDEHASPDHFSNKAFFEAYFSNFIEGTTFEIAEAEEIIFDGKIPPRRPKDAHDILGTFRIVSDQNGLKKVPSDFEGLLRLLKERHSLLMEFRPEAMPGRLKEKINRAGETVFVHPDLALGTLKKGMELYSDLPKGLPRAIFISFLVTDVHPFVDGNGRIARIMMNSELAALDLSTVIIPTVFREDYLLSLRALTRRHRPSPLVEALLKAQKFSNLDFSRYPEILKELERRNWFREPDAARILI